MLVELPMPSKAELERACAEAAGAWPKVRLDPAAFMAELARRVDGAADETAALAALPLRDLYLARACEAGDAAALAAFETEYLTEADAAAAILRAGSDVADEVKSRLREQLLVARDGRPPGISGYSGRGDLRGWLRVTAVREALRMVKKAKREVNLEAALAEELTAGADPELEQLKHRYRDEFNGSVREALTALPARERTLLRLHVVDRLSIDQIGAIHRVHRATAARWVAHARAELVTATHHRLAERLGVAGDEVKSIIRLVSSQLEVSVARLLAED
jgi:RNA polymerase sigma-70 factor, ECF subfamily